MRKIKVLLNFFKKEDKHSKKQVLKERIEFVITQDSGGIDNKKRENE